MGLTSLCFVAFTLKAHDTKFHSLTPTHYIIRRLGP